MPHDGSCRQDLCEQGSGGLVVGVFENLGGRAGFDDPALAEDVNHVGNAAGEVHGVGDDDHGQAVALPGRSSRPAPRRSFADRARWWARQRGWPGVPWPGLGRWPRAAAVRRKAARGRACSRSPMPTRSSSLQARSSAWLAAESQHVDRALDHVLQHRAVRKQVEALEDHAHAAGRPALDRFASAGGGLVGGERAGRRSAPMPAWNVSSPFRQRRNVLLPLPEGRSSRPPRPGAPQVHAPEHLDRPVPLDQAADLDHARCHHAPPFHAAAHQPPLGPPREPRKRHAHHHIQDGRGQGELDRPAGAVGQDRVLLGQLDQGDRPSRPTCP